jgi:sugar-specific transcriptional regulator TrmB
MVMNGILRDIGLTDNEIKLYITLLKVGSSTAYDLSKKTGIYRVHVYDKLEQLMDKGLVTHVYRGSKKHFQATPPQRIKQYLDEKRKTLDRQEDAVDSLLPELEAMARLPTEDIRVEVFKGKEGMKYFFKDIVKVGKEVLIMGMDDAKYEKETPYAIQQYFRDLRHKKIKERVIAVKKEGMYIFPKDVATTSTYRFLESDQFNPTNTFVYGDRVVIITWGTPVTAIMIQNPGLAETYRNHFEHLWKIASKSPNKR